MNLHKLLFLNVFAFTLLHSQAQKNYSIETKQSVTINLVSLVEFPEKKPSGFNWDNMPFDIWPDVYLKIGKNGFKRKVFNNLLRGGISWSLKKPYVINDLSQVTELSFFDEDAGINISKDDFIGSVQFNPNAYPSHPTSVIIKEPGITVELYLSWK
jgi:hypothetical protein